MASIWDRLFADVKVAATTLGDVAGSVLANLSGFASGDSDPNQESSTGEPLYGIPGFFARPRDPDADGHAEYIAARRDDGMDPLAGRDLRITKKRGPVARGSIGFGGYGGAFASFEDAASGKGNTFVVYVPTDFDGNGKPQKAHTLSLDSKPGAETILLLHKSGSYIQIDPAGAISIISANGQNFVSVDNSGVAFSGPIKQVTGALMGDVVSAQPLVIAPTAAWFAQVNIALAQIAVILNGPPQPPAAPAPVLSVNGSVTLVTAPPPLISTKSSASP